jgi:hypothetical protein
MGAKINGVSGFCSKTVLVWILGASLSIGTWMGVALSAHADGSLNMSQDLDRAEYRGTMLGTMPFGFFSEYQDEAGAAPLSQEELAHIQKAAKALETDDSSNDSSVLNDPWAMDKVALNEIREAQKLNPNHAEYWYFLGVLDAVIEKDATAITELQTFLQTPMDTSAYQTSSSYSLPKRRSQEESDTRNFISTLQSWGDGDRPDDNSAASVELKPVDLYQQGVAALKRGDNAGSFTYFQQGAPLGNAGCQYFLGYDYEHGYGTTVDMDQAKYWYQKASDQGFDDSLASGVLN